MFGADRARIDAEQSLIYCAKNLRDGKGSRWNLERQVRACSAKYGTSVERLSDLTKLSRREIRSILKGQESLGV